MGILHPDYLADLYTPRQLEDWELFHSIEPWGGPADDYRAGLITWGGIMPHASKRKVTPEQFIPKWGEQDLPTPEEYKAKAKRVYAAAAPRKQPT